MIARAMLRPGYIPFFWPVFDCVSVFLYGTVVVVNETAPINICDSSDCFHGKIQHIIKI